MCYPLMLGDGPRICSIYWWLVVWSSHTRGWSAARDNTNPGSQGSSDNCSIGLCKDTRVTTTECDTPEHIKVNLTSMKAATRLQQLIRKWAIYTKLQEYKLKETYSNFSISSLLYYLDTMIAKAFFVLECVTMDITHPRPHASAH